MPLANRVEHLVRFLILWMTLVAIVFWVEPLFIYRGMIEGNLGIGRFSWSAYAIAVLVWLIPLALIQVWAHIHDAFILPDSKLNIYDPAEPVERIGPKNRREFEKYFRPGVPSRMLIGAIVICLVLVLLTIGAGWLQATSPNRTFNFGEMWHMVLRITLGTYLVFSSVICVRISAKAWDQGSSILFMPWSKPWTWPYILMLLPFAAYYAMAMIRLVLTRERGRAVADVFREVGRWPEWS